MPTETGIFTKDEAVTGHAFSYRLAQYIGKSFSQDLPLYDIGCGPGSYLKYFQDIGFKELIGVEGTEDISFEVPKYLILTHDLTKHLDLHRNQGNLISIEVWEHIPREFEQVFVYNICRLVKKGCKLIVSCAHEGQQGYGHINCRPAWHVIKTIESWGFEQLNYETENLRSVIEGHYAYLKENLFVFKKI